MEVSNKGILESLLFVAGDEGLSLSQISRVMEITEDEAEELLEELNGEYSSSNRGIHILQMAGVYQLATKKDCSDYLKKLVESPGVQGLSQAALETLAIIAYKQPITRAEIEDIRGVKTERPLHTLVSKGLIKDVGRAEGAGRAYLYGTSKEFLDYFGLNTLDELPELKEEQDSFEDGDADLFFGNMNNRD
ncbi:SMC-Scp complex subunit ScpB [Peribacillus kribbensis]|uniref:SMC-Scp complex subunit ScpB n=1 Tax=Peribacillus kribbensis TaxID=356658 RepID=UPI0004793B2B|nr:SMC-Scp complex subunit ScpB [Peribacillus kribbensis]